MAPLPAQRRHARLFRTLNFLLVKGQRDLVGPDGLGHLRGYPEIHQPSRRARDSGTARRLWELSARLTGAEQTIRVNQPATMNG